MKKYIFSVVFLSTALLTSCSLDETPQSKFKESEAFANSTLTYVNSVAKVYSEIGDGIYVYGCDPLSAGVYFQMKLSFQEGRVTG